jgi:lipoprotein-releasing system permease protein
MFSPIERLLAIRYLRSRKAEGFISVVSGFSLVGIALGVATLIVVMAVMNGFRQELYSRILGMDGHVSVSNMVRGIQDYASLQTRIAAIEGVTSVNPMIEGQVMAMAGDVSTGAMVRGMRLEDVRQKKTLVDAIKDGVLEDFQTHNGVLIGARMARNLGLRVGDSITLVSPRVRSTVMGSMPRMKSFPIAAIFDVGMFEYDSGVIIMPMGEAQVFFQLPNAVNMLEIRTQNPMRAALTAREVQAVVGEAHNVYDWQRTHAHFVNALQVERNVMFLILTLIILVAAFNILSGLIMLVKDKEGAIAILRTMGATRGSIMRIFFLCGSSIGVLGTLLGVVLGLAFSLNIEHIRQFIESLSGTELFAAEIYYLSTLPADVQAHEVAQVVVMALVIAFLAPLYPSWRAAKTEPAEALRYGR